MRTLVAIPIYNELRYVSRVLAQVLRITDHLLVVDDGSTDGTADVLKKTEVVFFSLRRRALTSDAERPII